MEGENIVCFAKSWDEAPTSCNHVLRALAEKNKVLWINSIATRAPQLASRRDIKKIISRLRGALRDLLGGPVPMAPGLWRIDPLVLPFPHVKAAQRINRFILRLVLWRHRNALGMRDFQLWSFIPTAEPYFGCFGEKLSVFYCVDNYAGFRSHSEARTGSMMNSLASKADLVFATSKSLVAKLRPLNRRTHLASHGVDYENFAKALQDDQPVPGDIAEIAKPIIGYFGLIEDWLDFDLLAEIARKHPEWSLVLIGPQLVPIQALARFQNIYFLGRKAHHELAPYCRKFDVALIPHKINELTIHMNPIKLREYLSAGLPIVSTALPEATGLEPDCVTADSYTQFAQEVEQFLAKDTPADRAARSQRMAAQAWRHKVHEIEAKVVQALDEKSKSGLR